MSTASNDVTVAVGDSSLSRREVEDLGAPVGTSVGRYVLLEEVGRGAMGRVLRAYDPKLQREVALKEVRRAVLDEETTSRLVVEARAMAKLSHPNVVAVYDVEEIEDREAPRLMIVMEYVAGQTLKAWLDDGHQPHREVVARFIEAGRGLSAAHCAGLLHRDFKPANVLVGNGSSRIVKVSDFGLAKGATRSSLSKEQDTGETEDSLTQHGEVLGTPRYMAPEQHAGEELTSAADQYAFCVALWEALCGEPPFSGGDLRPKKHKGPPPWPNLLMPRPVAEAVRRGLSPEPSQRWPSMDALLDALAYDPSRRRNRWFFALAGVAAVGIAASWESWAAARAQQCTGAARQLQGVWDETQRGEAETAMLATGAPYALRTWENTARELDAYADAWTTMHTEACAATTLRGEQSTEVMDLQMACLHRAKVELQAATGVLAEADAEVVMNAHKLVGGLAELDRCADVDSLRTGVEPPRTEDIEVVEAARDSLAQSKAQREAGRYEQAQAKVADAQEAVRYAEYDPVRIELGLEKGDVLDKLGKYEDAEAALTHALELAAARGQLHQMQEAASTLLYVVGCQQQRTEEALLRYRLLALAATDKMSRAGALNNLAVVLDTQGKYEEAETEHRRALALREKTLGPEHPDVAMSRGNLANVLGAQGRYEEAETEHRRVLALRERTLGSEHPHVAMSRDSLANVLGKQGKYEEAETEHRRAMALREKTLGPEHPDVAASLNNLATALDKQGKYEEAEMALRRGLALTVKTVGPEHPHVANAHNNLANVLDGQEKYEGAEKEYRRALALWEKTLGPEHPYVAMSRNNLAGVLLARGKNEEAEAECRRALAILDKAVEPGHPHFAMSRNSLAGALQAQGKYEEAGEELRRALALWEKTLGPDHPDVVLSRHNLAGLLLEQGRADEALELAEQAWTHSQRDDIPPEHRAEVAFRLAHALWQTGHDDARRQRARRLAQRAAEDYRQAGDAHAEAGRRVQTWLAAHGGP